MGNEVVVVAVSEFGGKICPFPVGVEFALQVFDEKNERVKRVFESLHFV